MQIWRQTLQPLGDLALATLGHLSFLKETIVIRPRGEESILLELGLSETSSCRPKPFSPGMYRTFQNQY